MKIARRCIISGRVQGVFYRNATQQEALKLGVTGWTRNLPNGDVECVIYGESQAVDALCQWLRQGPPAAKVSDVKIEDVPWEDFDSFEIRRG